MNEIDLSYIAGFFDGEGSAFISQPKASNNGKRYARVTAKISQNDKAILDWIASLYGFGKIYIKNDGRVNTNHYIVFAHRQARYFLSSIEPYLRVKRENVSSILDQFGRLYEYQPRERVV